jgi:hypothetical protein
VWLLGALRVVDDTGERKLRGHRVRSLFAWLALHPGIGYPRDFLVELPWPHTTADRGRRNLSDVLYHLRHSIGPEWIEVGGVQIDGGLDSIGGAFGMAHYFEYRSTHDVHAWWMDHVSPAQRIRVAETLADALKPYGLVRTRSWGDVVSVELRSGEGAGFSFQIAERTARLGDPRASSWPGILVDAFDDLVASKMVALIERGAPRDFLDIYTLAASGRYAPETAWRLCRERHEASGADDERERARLAVQTHMARIELARPLDEIADPEDRLAASRLRAWFVAVFLHAMD